MALAARKAASLRTYAYMYVYTNARGYAVRSNTLRV